MDRPPEKSTLFMSVRNPFDRLVSSYFNKVFPWRLYNGKIQKHFRRIKNWVLKKFDHKNLTAYQKEWYNSTFEE